MIIFQLLGDHMSWHGGYLSQERIEWSPQGQSTPFTILMHALSCVFSWALSHAFPWALSWGCSWVEFRFRLLCTFSKFSEKRICRTHQGLSFCLFDLWVRWRTERRGVNGASMWVSEAAVHKNWANLLANFGWPFLSGRIYPIATIATIVIKVIVISKHPVDEILRLCTVCWQCRGQHKTECATAPQLRLLAIFELQAELQGKFCNEKHFWPFFMSKGIANHEHIVSTQRSRNLSPRKT